jgi:hypothetical protein
MELILVLTTLFQGELMSLEYVKIEVEEGEVLLSPSSLSQMFDNPYAWYKTYILKEKSFNGNDNTYLGSLLHNRIENYYLGSRNGGYTPNKDDEVAYLDSNNAIDSWGIMEALEPMYNTWVEQYGKKFPKPNELELTLTYKPTDGFVLGGSIDAIVGNTVVDWKTSAKSKSSLADYKMQLYIYAYIARKNGFDINHVCVVNIVKPTVKGEVKVNVLTEPIDEDYMTELLRLIRIKVKAIRMAKNMPDLVDVLWQNNPFSFRT